MATGHAGTFTVRLGTIEAGLSSSPVVLLDEYFKLLDAPVLFVDREHVSRALDGPLGARLARPLEERGIKHLGYWENGYRQITNNVRPIVKPADLKGIKLRTDEQEALRFDAGGSAEDPGGGRP